ncbi:MAG: Radical SAM domain protein [Candidatus Moranbacteria bacterium GW2011_GWE1_35_17]|nr:MAG: Radical SAM domain protein [Candidatus Moranbacteria bacterium GW2011_GWE1_35_17]KKP73165.1 MAG: Radical SAM domain protein [Candidatus Moranbacteria bacterium GW2011_GWE2_35_164]KKP84920.1 MAG: Radical SAM domain protein [Candidatus Moranbacteria bacterium GW2011_GWF2_35_54]
MTETTLLNSEGVNAHALLPRLIDGGFKMECVEKTPTLSVETEEAIYEIEFAQIQIEITGRCNMHCQHCRAAHEVRKDMPIDQIIKIIRFARRFSPNYKEIVVSGGEPLIHHDFFNVLEAVRRNGGEFVTLTTNGSLLTEKHLSFIRDLEFQRFILSVSLDSLDAGIHDNFRSFPGAFEKALRSVKMIVEADIPNVMTSVRTTLRPEQIGEMEDIVDFVFSLGVKRSSLSPIHPSGRSIERPDLWMSKEQKKKFMENLYRLKGKYPNFQVSTSDPLKCLFRGYHDVGGENELVFDGCSAAAVTFNVGADGTMTPCALLNIPMMNVFDLSIEEITESYRNNEIVKNMLDMNLKGKCGVCPKKYQCGGCRARAHVRKGDYLEEDPDCWL